MGIGDFLLGSDPEKYNPNTQQGIDARTFGVGGPNTSLNIQGAQLNTGDYNQDRTQQLGLAGALQAASQGQGPSAAQMAGQQSRDASLTQAAALQAGRRGQNAAAGARMAANQMGQGIQAANAQQAQGQAQEMATARGQLGGVLSGLAGQDIGVAGQNAGLQQQAALANQQTQYGIGSQELAARQQENQMSYGNLNPGQPSGLLSLAGDAAKIGGAFLAKGGVVMPHYADGNVSDGTDVSRFLPPQQYTAQPTNGGGTGQLMGIGQRVMPMFNQRQRQFQSLADAIAGAVSQHISENRALEKRSDKEAQDVLSNPTPTTAPTPVTEPQDQQAPRLSLSPDVTPTPMPAYPALPEYARGKVIPGPHAALVGEAGPEIVLHLGDALTGRPTSSKRVDGPTITALGRGGVDAVVNRRQQAEGRRMIAKADGTPSPIVSSIADISQRVDRLEHGGMPHMAKGGLAGILSGDHMAAGHGSLAHDVVEQLEEDFPADKMGWVHEAQWSGPKKVSLDDVDFSKSASWRASREPKKVAKFEKKISKGWMKPVILVARPGSDRMMIVDGHHRALAYQELGKPIMAYVAQVKTEHGPWDEFHSTQHVDEES